MDIFDNLCERMKRKVLIIEDDQAILEIVKLVLIDGGYLVTGVNAEKAKKLSGYQSDLIILDDWTNKSNNNLFCKTFSSTKYISIPVLMISTAPHIEDIARACPAEQYLRKPFDIDELLDKVNHMCL